MNRKWSGVGTTCVDSCDSGPRRRTRTNFRTGLGVAVFFAIFSCFVAGNAAVAAATRVQIFLPTATIGWGFYLAEKKGYFKAEGIEANIRVFSSGAEAAQAFQALRADVLEAGDMPAMIFAERGEGAAVIAGQVARTEKGIQLIGPSSIRGPADLKGKKIATIFGATNEYYTRKYIREKGLEGQVTIINLDPGSQVPALLRGDVDAIVTFSAFGVRLLSSDKYRLIDAWPSSMMLVVSKKFADSQAAAVEGVLRALQRAAEDIKANPKAAVAAVSGEYGVVAKAYEDDLSYGGLDLFPQYPFSTHAFLEGVSTFLVEQGRLKKPFDFCSLLDLRYLRKVSPHSVVSAPSCK